MYTDYIKHKIYPHEAMESAKDRVSVLRATPVLRPEDKIVESTIESLLSNRRRNATKPGSEEKMGLVLYGESGAGKTELLRRVLSKPSITPPHQAYHTARVRLKAPVRLASAGFQVIKTLGYDAKVFRPSQDYWSTVGYRAADLGTAILHLDETQDAFRQNRAVANTWLQTFKGLMELEEVAPLVMILSGTPEMRPYFETTDPQAPRRMVEVDLPSLTFPSNTPGLSNKLDKYCKLAGITNGLEGTDYERLMRAAAYQFGRTFSLGINGIREAILAGKDTLNLVHLAHAFERDSPKTLPAHNFFWTPDYMRLDPYGSGYTSNLVEAAVNRKPLARKDTKW